MDDRTMLRKLNEVLNGMGIHYMSDVLEEVIAALEVRTGVGYTFERAED